MLTKQDQALVVLRICKRAGWSYRATRERISRTLGMHPLTVVHMHERALQRWQEERMNGKRATYC